MKDIKEFYILGLPVETDIGECDFFKVKEYPDYFAEFQVLSMNKGHIIHKYKQMNKDRSLDSLIEELERLSLYEITLGIPEIHQSYLRVFQRAFNSEESLQYINAENFEYFRKLVLRMNSIKEEIINPNPEIQRAIERSKRVKQRESGNLEFADIVTSIVGYNGLSYADVNELTIYQLYMTYHRIAQFKNYDTSTLFATVSEKAKIESWSKHIDLYEEEKHFVTQDEFKKNTASAFDE